MAPGEVKVIVSSYVYVFHFLFSFFFFLVAAEISQVRLGAANGNVQALSEWFPPVSQPSVNATCNDLVL